MKAIITRNDQTAILELPTSRMELAGSLSRIGIRTPAHIIPCSDEEEDYIKVKFFGESDFENELTALAMKTARCSSFVCYMDGGISCRFCSENPRKTKTIEYQPTKAS